MHFFSLVFTVYHPLRTATRQPGRVVLCDWLHIEMAYSPADVTHLCITGPRLEQLLYIDLDQRVTAKPNGHIQYAVVKLIN